MAKAVKVLCDRCESKILAGVSFCDHCGCPTRWASHEERVSWELDQWKTKDRSEAAASSSQSRHGSRRWFPKPFGRRAEEKPALTLVSQSEIRSEAMYVAPAAAVSAAVSAAPAPAATVAVAPTPAPRVERTTSSVRSAARPKAVRSTAIKPSPRDNEALADTPATVMAMRLLNARVAELDAKIQRIERALDTDQSISLP